MKQRGASEASVGKPERLLRDQSLSFYLVTSSRMMSFFWHPVLSSFCFDHLISVVLFWRIVAARTTFIPSSFCPRSSVFPQSHDCGWVKAAFVDELRRFLKTGRLRKDTQQHIGLLCYHHSLRRRPSVAFVPLGFSSKSFINGGLSGPVEPIN